MMIFRWDRVAAIVVSMGLYCVPVASGTEAGGVAGTPENEKMETASKTMVLIGASYAGGWDPGRPIAGYRLVNKGVNGQQSFEMLARFETDVIGLKPDVVIIWGFINDVFRSDRAQIDQTLRRTRESIVAMVELSRKAGVTPVLATEVTIRSKHGWVEAAQTMVGRLLGKSSYQDYINGHVLEINRWVSDMATREGIVLLDLEGVLSDSDHVRRKEYSQPDGSHISARGYETITHYVEERMKASLREQ
jgi:lysophospholipase L1-like esterase